MLRLNLAARPIISCGFGNRRRFCGAGTAWLFVGLGCALWPLAVRAASSTWKASPGSGDWGTAGNWMAGVPGISGGGSTSSDVATFLTSSTTTISNAATFNIGGITFGTSGSVPSSFTIGTIGGEPLDLTSGGTIQIASGAITTVSTGPVTETINAPLVIEGTNGTYMLANNAGSSSSAQNVSLDFGGGITGGASGATVLTLGGAGFTENADTISGTIANGSATSMAVTVTSHFWQLTGNNTYTGTTTVGSGLTLVNLHLDDSTANGGSNVAIPGKLQIGGSDAIITCNAANQFSGTNTVVSFLSSFEPSTLFLDGFNQSIAGLNSVNSNVFVSNGGTTAISILTINGGGSYSFNGNLGGDPGTKPGLTMAGAGSQTLSGGGIGYTGPTTVNAGTLILSNTTGYASPTTINSGGTLAVNGTTGTATIALNNGGILENQSPAGTSSVAEPVTNNGSTTISQSSSATGASGEGFYLDGGLAGGGTITISNANPGSGVNFRHNNSTFSGTLIVNGAASATPFAGSGIGVGGAGTSLENADIQLNGTMELNNGGIGSANTAAGAFTMGALSGSGVMVGNSASTTTTTVTLGFTNNSGTFSGTIADGQNDTLSIVKTGSGTQVFLAVNSYSGGTTINGGVLQLDLSGALPANSPLSLDDSGSLDLNGTSATVSSLNSSSAATAIYGNFSGFGGSGTLTFAGSGSPSTYAGRLLNQISFFGGLPGLNLVVSSGSLTLSNPSNFNLYSGTTQITGGTLVAGVADALSPGSAVAVSGTGTLDASDDGNTVAALTINAGGTLDLGLGNVLLSNGDADFGGTLTLSGTPTAAEYELIGYTSESGTFAITNLFPGYTLVYNPTELDLVATSVPEPSTLFLAVLGGLGVALAARRRTVRWTAYAMTANQEGTAQRP